MLNIPAELLIAIMIFARFLRVKFLLNFLLMWTLQLLSDIKCILNFVYNFTYATIFFTLLECDRHFESQKTKRFMNFCSVTV